MKKWIMAICASCVIFSEMAFVNALEVENDGRKYKIKSEAENGEKVTMLISEKGSTLENNSEIIALKEDVSENEEIVFVFDFPAAVTEGEYTVYVTNNSTGERITRDIYYATEERLGEFRAFLENTGDKDGLISKIIGEYKIVSKASGVETDCFADLADREKESVVDLFVAGKKDASDTVSLFNGSIGTVMINSDYDTDRALICLNGEEYSVADDELKEWIKRLISDTNDYTTVADARVRYDESCILYKFSTAKFSEFDDLFEEYADKLDITDEDAYETYMSLSTSKKSDVGVYLEKKQKQVPAETVPELVNYLYDGCKSVKSETKKSTGGGSTGGGAVSSKPAVNVIPGGNTTEKDPVSEPVKSDYSDMSGVEWAQDAVKALTGKGIILGDGDGKFRPFDNITREEFVKILVMAVNAYDENAECSFSDVSNSAWYYTYVSSAYKAGIVNGITESEFGTGKPVTRQEMAALAARAADRYKKLDFVREEKVFADGDKIADYAKTSVDTLYRAGIMSGVSDEYFEPESNANRAQAAVLIYNLIK